MKNLLFFVALCISSYAYSDNHHRATSPVVNNTYYVSPDGDDQNDGTIDSPFATWGKLSSVLEAGDVAYIRGGVYYTQLPASAWEHCLWQNLNGNETDSIYILAYPGEHPVLDLSNFTPTNSNPTAVRVRNCNYVHIKGLRITGLKQIPSGDGISRGMAFENSSHNKIEQIELDHIGGYGFNLENGSNDNLFLNCDAHHMDDRHTPDDPWGNANGFQSTGGSTATRNTFEGCRAWWISDDGFDLFGSNGEFTFKNCWSFWNGYEPGTFTQRGDGDGFKLGPQSASNTHNTLLRNVIQCLSFENSGSGYDQNNGDMQYKMYNNSSFKNGSYGYMFDYISPAPSQDFKNNLSFLDFHPRRGNETNGSNNSWNLQSNLTSSDFLSISSSGADGARQPDGSLPHLNFMRPSSTSRLIDRGAYVGLPYTGNNPDIGAFEFEVANQNEPPTADAGTDITETLPINNITLNGSGYDSDGDIVSFQWSKISGPANSGFLSQPESPTTNISTLLEGVYQYELTVTDNSGANGRDTVRVTLLPPSNIPPVAHAGDDQSIVLPTNTVDLSGTGTDEDGDIVSYSWSSVSGPSGATITDPSSASTTVNNLVQGVYIFKLTVIDDGGSSDFDEVVITVYAAPNQLPIVNAGSAQTITAPENAVTLTGTASDPDGSIASYSWIRQSGPSGAVIANPNSATTEVSGLVTGTYQFQLTVTDNSGASASDVVQITVLPPANQPPIVDAGEDIEFSLPTNSITVTGVATDPDGTIASTKWRKLSGPSGPTIQNNNWPVTNINGFITPGTYKYEFRATDNQNATSRDTVLITVLTANQLPSADAGNDQVITLPVNSTTLSGSGIDSDGEIVSYSWSLVSGPSTATIQNPTDSITGVSGLIEGTYTFLLTVTDNRNGAGTDMVQVTVNPRPNIPPTVSAGANQTITLPQDTATLVGAAGDEDGQIVSIEWTQASGPSTATIASPNAFNTSIGGLVEGVYEFLLSVTDDDGAESSSLTQVTVLSEEPQTNIPPVANAGPDFSISLPDNYTPINGSGSDEDGTIVAYKWRRISGANSVIISNSQSATCTVSNLAQGTYRFELKVTDNDGANSRDTVTLTVLPAPNQLPVSIAGNDITITLPQNNTVVNGKGTDADGYIVSYLWSKVDGPSTYQIGNPWSRNTSITNLIEGDYAFELTVTDNRGGVGRDTLTIHVLPVPNIPPVANAGPSQTITLPENTATLSGSGTDTDGTIVAYNWALQSGPEEVVFSSPNEATTQISSLIEGNYIFKLTVTDNDGAAAESNTTVRVVPAPNQPPVANAGPDQIIQLPAEYAQLNGSGSDPDGSITGYAWRLISGPAGGGITNPQDASTLIVALYPGIYHFELTVYDNNNAWGKDTVQLTVMDIPNQLPIVNAGNDVQITLPQNSISITGTASDPDGYIISYNWIMLYGPTGAILTNYNQPTVSISGLTQGTYQFVFSAWDNDYAYGRDTVMVTVLAPPPNQPPVVSAGPDLVTTIPINSGNVYGSASDPDGSIAGLFWSQASGPSQSTMSNINSATLSVSNLVVGEYRFVLRATDNLGAVARDTMKFTVKPAPNIPPMAFAGNNQTIILPVNSTILYGSGSDADGSIVSYLWEKISGGTADIISPHTPSTAVQSLLEGTYAFKLTVKDNNGTSASDTVMVTVLAPPNQPPVVSVGPDLQIQLPVNYTSLIANASDPDGEIISYHWAQLSGPSVASISTPNAATTSVGSLIEGVYNFSVTVSDNRGSTASATVQVTVLHAPNVPPVANAGSDITIRLPEDSVEVNGTGTDADGLVLAYHWNAISGPSTAFIQHPTSASTQISNLSVTGTYQFELVVQDNSSAIGRDTLLVHVLPPENRPPSVSAGNDIEITLPQDSAIVFGNASDGDGEVTGYLWSQLSGPSIAIIANPYDAQTLISDLTEGLYQFMITVWDNDGETASDTLNILVHPAPNQLPIADAGADRSLVLPTNHTTLSGAGTDPDGYIVWYSWTQLDGPVQILSAAVAQQNISIQDLQVGNYLFELTVMDNSGGWDKDTVQVTVSYAALHIGPKADAGPDKTITLPLDSVKIVGKGKSDEGYIASYSWEIISTHDYQVSELADSILYLSALSAGEYTLVLTVTDNWGASASDSATVLVLPHKKQKDGAELIPWGNPFRNSLHIEVIWNSDPSCKGILELYDESGKRVDMKKLSLSQTSQHVYFNTSGLASGFYFVRLSTDCSVTIIRKLIKR